MASPEGNNAKSFRKKNGIAEYAASQDNCGSKQAQPVARIDTLETRRTEERLPSVHAAPHSDSKQKTRHLHREAFTGK
jgi:hypothetical protein